MIAFLTGRVAAKTASFCLLDVGGVGYRLAMSTPSLAALPAEGDAVTIFTHLHVREDELSLFGFESPEEQATFEALISVSGVGPKVALATLSTLNPDELAAAVAAQDVSAVSRVPGIGKKTAQRIIIDLTDKVGSSVPGAAGGGRASSAIAEATDALMAMGFSAAEAAAALKGADAADAGALLKYALKRLGGGS